MHQGHTVLLLEELGLGALGLVKAVDVIFESGADVNAVDANGLTLPMLKWRMAKSRLPGHLCNMIHSLASLQAMVTALQCAAVKTCYEPVEELLK